MDEKTLLQIYRSCYPDIARYILNRGGTAEQAEEAFHAALSAMLHQMEKGNTIGDYGGYLFKSAWNAFLAECRHQNRFDSEEQGSGEDSPNGDDFRMSTMSGQYKEVVEPGPGPDYEVHRQMMMDAAESIIAEMSPALQKILTLSFDPELNLDDEQIAHELKVTTDYVRVARFRAMRILREKMYNRGFGSL